MSDRIQIDPATLAQIEKMIKKQKLDNRNRQKRLLSNINRKLQVAQQRPRRQP